MKLWESAYAGIRKWMYRNARPLELALFQFYFEEGNKQSILAALAAYQNEDGGFAHGLEADSWNPNSSPMQTWSATEVIYSIGETNPDSPIVKGILSYLDNCPHYKDGIWMGTIPTNNHFPHAPWWSYNDEMLAHWRYNPTACLAGFILLFADGQSSLYQRAEQIARETVKWYMSEPLLESMHESLCFIRLWQYCKRAGKTDLFDMDQFEHKLRMQVKGTITQDRASWKTDYICKPSQFFHTKESIFYGDNMEIAEYETEFIISTINKEGAWDISWNWNSYPDEWPVSRLWWKAGQVLVNLRYLKGMDCL